MDYLTGDRSGSRAEALPEAAMLTIFDRKFAALADEMYHGVQRAARSNFVKEAADFATGLLDPQGNVFAYPPSATFAFLIDTDFYETIRHFPALRPGDVILTNDPYTSGAVSTHLPDLHVFRPYFHRGRIIAYGWSFVHCADIGGAVAGSIAASLTSIYEEGLRIPPTLIVREDEIDADLLDRICLNSRMPEMLTGDLLAMLGALKKAETRLGALFDDFGADAVLAAQSGLQDYAAARARTLLRTIPDGDYAFWDYLDDDSVTGIPVRLRVNMAVRDGIVRLDLAGTDPRVRSSYNVPTMRKRMYWLTFRMTAFLTTLDPTLPLNAGLYRDMFVEIPEASIFNAEAPDAVGLRGIPSRRLFDCVTGALALAVPDQVSAPGGGLSVALVFAEPDGGGSEIVEVLQPLRCGMGALHGRDGVDVRDNNLNNMRNHPVEVIEKTSSVRVLCYDINPDSGGAGTWRGGVGQTMNVEVLCERGTFLARGLDRLRFSAWGLAGGAHPTLAQIILNEGRPDERVLSKLDRLPVRRGDVLTIRLPGGGGLGDPFQRDPAAVAEDVASGFVTEAAALRDYGVVIRDGEVDEAATRAARTGPSVDHGWFGFNEDRRIWDETFPDRDMSSLNALLDRVDKSGRQDVRGFVFEEALPGISQYHGPVSRIISDPAQTRARFRQAVAAAAARLDNTAPPGT